MADVNDVAVIGFGSWSDVYSLPTLGFGINITAESTCTDLPPQMLLVTKEWNLGRWQPTATRDMEVGTDATTGTAIPDWRYSTGFAKEREPHVVKGVLIDPSTHITVSVSKTVDGLGDDEKREAEAVPQEFADEVWVPGAGDLRGHKFRLQLDAVNACDVRRVWWERQPIDGAHGG